VTRHPTAERLARQITEAFPWASAPAYLVRDNDRSYGHIFKSRLGAMGIRDRPISPGSPWPNAYVERLIGAMRRECLDRVLIFGEGHLRKVLASYAAYYNEVRTHLRRILSSYAAYYNQVRPHLAGASLPSEQAWTDNVFADIARDHVPEIAHQGEGEGL
jgi:transposase InsO family protein